MSVFDERRGTETPWQLPWATQTATGRPSSQTPGANTQVPYPFEEVARRNGARYRGEPWRVNGVVIIASTNFAGDTTGTRVETAEGYTYTSQDETGSNIVDVVTFTVPHGVVCVIEEVGLRAESELGFQLVQFDLLIGGSAGAARSGQSGRVIQPNLGRPYDRDGTIKVWKRATGGTVVRLQATNTSTESVHVVEASMAGALFPIEWLGNEKE